MIHRTLIVAVVLAWSLRSVQGQTVPPEAWGRSGPQAAKSAPARPEKRQLTIDDSRKRIAEAKQLFSKGNLAEADKKLRGADFIVRLERSMDQRDVAFAQGLMLLTDGSLAGAYQQAAYIHRVGKPGEVNIAAALLKAMVFLRAGILPLARHWADWAGRNGNWNIASATILTVIDQLGGHSYALERTVNHETQAGFKIDIWRADESYPQPLTLVVRRDDSFCGAFAIEYVTTGGTRTAGWRYYDLDGPPLFLTYLGDTNPTADELLKRVRQFNPQTGKERYSILRAELEALAWQRAGIAPCAALWGDYARGGSKLIQETVFGPMQKSKNASWDYLGREEVADGADFKCEMRQYGNRDVATPKQVQATSGPLEHRYFTLIAPDSRTHLGSFVVTSAEPIEGERIYYLYFVSDGDRRQIKRYDDLDPPSLDQIQKDVRHAMRETPASALAE